MQPGPWSSSPGELTLSLSLCWARWLSTQAIKNLEDRKLALFLFLVLQTQIFVCFLYTASSSMYQLGSWLLVTHRCSLCEGRYLFSTNTV